jgi:hypothetical protein
MWFFVILAFVTDLGSYFGGYSRRSEIRYPSQPSY